MSDDVKTNLTKDVLVSFSLAGAFAFAIGASAFVKYSSDAGQFRTKPDDQIEAAIEQGIEELVRDQFLVREP